ncbi:uncharacterized protein PV09_05538 [Verruconis gallopava]|uniref:Fe2OG dioxygenase domain-containing protein n=1 Tax=Verruconis gallopava TaxID=253628 RepID=A0A0D1XLL9_9PEZI|nr:uncharacterized protein PV09_05538 [Verruconis gallopava]KIW03326.1 hypothetical protein PV09_05538 [Verruconis gallopava]
MTEIAVPAQVPNLLGKPILRDEVKPRSSLQSVQFDPEKHLSYKDSPKTYTLEDFGIVSDRAISPVAVTEPFPLFSEETVQIMRKELFTKEVWENCVVSTEFAHCQIRDYAAKYAPFTYDAWKHPKTLEIISKLAGVDLVTNLDLEISNINVATQGFDDGEPKKEGDNDLPATKWHYDSYPFVCVVMLSDTTNMVGGETAIKKPSGEVVRIRGPSSGNAVVMQGRCLNHQALAAHGGVERIVAVTSFRPRDSMMMDTSVLTTIRPITDHSQLYYEWAEYRTEVLQDRLRAMLKVLREQHRAGRKTDKVRLKKFLKEQEEWLARTNEEIV